MSSRINSNHQSPTTLRCDSWTRPYSPCCESCASADLFKRALRNKTQYMLSFYDSLIVAAAQEAGCTRLYSEDMQHGQVIGKLKIVNPFVG